MLSRIGRIAEALPGAIGSVGIGGIKDARVAINACDGATMRTRSDDDRIRGHSVDVRPDRVQANGVCVVLLAPMGPSPIAINDWPFMGTLS